jgi:hypothetical protein
LARAETSRRQSLGIDTEVRECPDYCPSPSQTQVVVQRFRPNVVCVTVDTQTRRAVLRDRGKLFDEILTIGRYLGAAGLELDPRRRQRIGERIIATLSIINDLQVQLSESAKMIVACKRAANIGCFGLGNSSDH